MQNTLAITTDSCTEYPEDGPRKRRQAGAVCPTLIATIKNLAISPANLKLAERGLRLATVDDFRGRFRGHRLTESPSNQPKSTGTLTGLTLLALTVNQRSWEQAQTVGGVDNELKKLYKEFPEFPPRVDSSCKFPENYRNNSNSSNAKKAYKMMGDEADFRNAQNMCRKDNAWLVMPKTSSDIANIFELGGGTYNGT